MSNAENSDMVEVEPAPSPAPRIEYRQSNYKKTAINKFFFVQHLNGLPTDKRQCIRCKHIVTACNGGTSNMRKHYQKCLAGQIILPTDQNSLGFKPAGCISRRLDKGLSDVAKLVYLDNFSVNSVVK